MLQLLFLLLRGVLGGFRSRRDVALENLVLRHQLQVALRTNPTPRLGDPDRVLWVWLRQLWPGWRDHLLIVQPETVIRWHRKGWRLYWSWKSRSRLGRPRLSPEVRELIGCRGQKAVRAEICRWIGRMLPCGMLQLLLLLVRSLLVGFRSHRDVALENLVLRHQLQVALRASRSPDSSSQIACYGCGCAKSGRPGGTTC